MLSHFLIFFIHKGVLSPFPTTVFLNEGFVHNILRTCPYLVVFSSSFSKWKIILGDIWVVPWLCGFTFSSFLENVWLKHYFPGFLSSRWRNTWENGACSCRRCRVVAGRLMEGLYLLSYLRGLKHYFSGLCVLASLSRDYIATAWVWRRSSLSRSLPGTRVGRESRPVWRTFLSVKISLEPRRDEDHSDIIRIESGKAGRLLIQSWPAQCPPSKYLLIDAFPFRGEMRSW